MLRGKLVRNKIPALIEDSGKKPVYMQADDSTFEGYLKEKVLEEAHELINATSKENMIEEIADLYAVLDEYMKFYDIRRVRVIAEQAYKRMKKGSFSDHIILKDVKETKRKRNTSKDEK